MRKKLEVVSRQREANELCPGRDVLHHLLPSVLKINLDSEQWRQRWGIGSDHVERAGFGYFMCDKWNTESLYENMSQRYGSLGDSFDSLLCRILDLYALDQLYLIALEYDAKH